jgi:hypothetical protein
VRELNRNSSTAITHEIERANPYGIDCASSRTRSQKLVEKSCFPFVCPAAEANSGSKGATRTREPFGICDPMGTARVKLFGWIALTPVGSACGSVLPRPIALVPAEMWPNSTASTAMPAANQSNVDANQAFRAAISACFFL